MEPIYDIKDDKLVVCLSGEIDHHIAGKIRESIDKEIELYGINHLIMDFSDVKFMDSSGVGMVLGRYNNLKERGGVVTICNCEGYIKKILYMSGVFTLIEYADSKEKALKGGENGK